MEKDKLEELKLLSAKIRKDVLEMLEKRGYGHMGGSLSIVELMSVLYGKQLRYDAKNPDWDDKYGDRMQKIVFIGQHLDKEQLVRDLDACLE